MTIRLAFGVTIALIMNLIFSFGCDNHRVKINLPNASWERIFFKDINRVTNLADVGELRKLNVDKGDIQVRVWRGFGLSPLEGVILKRLSGQWSATHIRADSYYEAENVDVIKLEPPKSGWDPFWKSIVDKGLLTLPDPSEIDCEVGGIDGTGYVVEINQDKAYRTYRYRSGECSEVKQMDEIGEIIGLEFDSGQVECKTAEWFPCMTLNKARDVQ